MKQGARKQIKEQEARGKVQEQAVIGSKKPKSRTRHKKQEKIDDKR